MGTLGIPNWLRLRGLQRGTDDPPQMGDTLNHWRSAKTVGERWRVTNRLLIHPDAPVAMGVVSSSIVVAEANLIAPKKEERCSR